MHKCCTDVVTHFVLDKAKKKKKLLYWRNPTDSKIRPDPTFKKKKRQENDRPILKKAKPAIDFFNIGSKNVNFGVWDLVGSLKCVFLYVFHIPAEISILPKMSRHSCIEPTIWNV